MTPDEEAIQRVALLPCPFCGGAATKRTGSDFTKANHTVHCTSCFSSSPVCATEAEAVAMWNRRSSADWWHLAGVDAGIGQEKHDE